MPTDRPVVALNSVELTYPIYSMRERSLRYSVANLAVGGNLMKTGNNTVVVQALSGISFELFPGDRLAIVGPNGAGKSTLLKVLAGVYEPDRGRVEINGVISSMLDIGQGLDAEATGVENIKLLAAMRGYSPWRLKGMIDEIVEFSGLGGYANMPVRVYSAGMATRLLFATATAFDHDILLLEEWLTAGDAAFVDQATKRMNEVVEEARVIITATHSMDLARNIANKVLRLEHGRVVYFGAMDDYEEPTLDEAPLAAPITSA